MKFTKEGLPIVQISGETKTLYIGSQPIGIEPIKGHKKFRKIIVKSDRSGNLNIENEFLSTLIPELSKEEKLQIADFMAQRWSEYANKLKED